MRCAFRRATGRGLRAEDERLRSGAPSRWLHISDPRLLVVIWPTAVARTPDAAAHQFCSALPSRRDPADPGLSMRRRSPASPVASRTVPRISSGVGRNRRSRGSPAARSLLDSGQAACVRFRRMSDRTLFYNSHEPRPRSSLNGHGGRTEERAVLVREARAPRPCGPRGKRTPRLPPPYASILLTHHLYKRKVGAALVEGGRK